MQIVRNTKKKKIIKELINGRGIFSVIKLAPLQGNSCLHWSGAPGRCLPADWVGKGSASRGSEGSRASGLRGHRAIRINNSTSDLYTVIKVQSNTTLCPFYFYSANGTLHPKLRLLFSFDVIFYIGKVLYNPSLAILFSLYEHHSFHKLGNWGLKRLSNAYWVCNQFWKWISWTKSHEGRFERPPRKGHKSPEIMTAFLGAKVPTT